MTAALQELIEQFGLAAIPDSVLSRIAVPTSLIWGRYDSVVPLSVGESASARYGWPLSVIEDAGNEPAIEEPQAFLRALRIALGPASRVEAAS
jgi:pimeloyl-ACP methyl ester carboxylesterase